MKLTIKNCDETIQAINIYCVTRNYIDHAKELGNELPVEPIFFMKSTSTLVNSGTVFSFPEDKKALIHYEGELVVVLGADCGRIDEKLAESVILGYAVGIDYTLRSIQNISKQNGLPWTFGKNFYGSAPLSEIVLKNDVNLYDNNIKLSVNGEICQDGTIADMNFSIPYLISYLSHKFPLRRGDLIFTGTPSGVGAVAHGDELICWMDGMSEVKSYIK